MDRDKSAKKGEQVAEEVRELWVEGKKYVFHSKYKL